MKYLYEFIGTFFLVLTVGMTVLNPGSVGPFAPLAIGSALAVMVFAGGHVSGGHYNPAVSLAAFMRKKLNSKDLGLYWIAQLLGGVVAAMVTLYLKGNGEPAPMELDYLPALLAEFLFTFALCFVVLNVATARATAGNSYFGLAIGFTVLVGAYAVGAISGGAFNPAVALGITILNISAWSNIWVYVVANLLGGAAAALVVKDIP
ncbi:MAG: aquaporin [Parachlamydiaceae bacterium]|nr:aquaporin [Parachlamydiaceae bacterium]